VPDRVAERRSADRVDDHVELPVQRASRARAQPVEHAERRFTVADQGGDLGAARPCQLDRHAADAPGRSGDGDPLAQNGSGDL
jgi:hypothetical protein